MRWRLQGLNARQAPAAEVRVHVGRVVLDASTASLREGLDAVLAQEVGRRLSGALTREAPESTSAAQRMTGDMADRIAAAIQAALTTKVAP